MCSAHKSSSKAQAQPPPNPHELAKSWEKGALRCPKCHKSVPLEELGQLQLNNCPHCSTPFFVPQRIRDYYLYEPCGGGGMGSVYKAVSVKYPDRVLAVKVLSRKERMNPPNIHAILNEALVSYAFSGTQFLAACLDSGFADDEYFTVMEFVDGERLDKRIERLGMMPEAEVIPMAMHLLAAEQHIYRRGYLFRDMKPENVIINTCGYAVLLDFGLCIPLAEARNPTDEFISGSPYYMPPERLMGRPEDACSDIYSLGMVMYHALTGHTLYDASGLESLAQKHVAKMKVSNLSKMTNMSSGMAELLDRMIQQSPEERPQSFQEVHEALKAIAG